MFGYRIAADLGLLIDEGAGARNDDVDRIAGHERRGLRQRPVLCEKSAEGLRRLAVAELQQPTQSVTTQVPLSA